LHSRSTRYPFVGRFEPLLEIVVRHHARRRVVSNPDDFDPGQNLVVVVTGVFVADLYDLATIIRSAMTAHKMRTLGLMTLVALDGRNRTQFPISRPTAARFTARRLPL
jgi:hypothetical protein